VERGYQRFCEENGAEDANTVWKGSIRIIDSLFEVTAQDYYQARADRDAPPDTLFVVGDYEAAASIPIGATLPYLEREHARLPAAFYKVFVHCLYVWMRVYDYTDAYLHAEMMMDGLEEQELMESYFPEVARSTPKCLPKPPLKLSPTGVSMAVRFLEFHVDNLQGSVARRLVSDVLAMHNESRGRDYQGPHKLAEQVPGLEEYLSEADDCGPGCAITWYEDDVISAAFDDQMQWLGQNGSIAPSLLLLIALRQKPEHLDLEVKRVFDYVGAMLRTLRIGARAVSLIRDIYDEYLSEHRKKPGLQAEPGTTCVRDQ
jgi:hypothetical protein